MSTIFWGQFFINKFASKIGTMIKKKKKTRLKITLKSINNIKLKHLKNVKASETYNWYIL